MTGFDPEDIELPPPPSDDDAPSDNGDDDDLSWLDAPKPGPDASLEQQLRASVEDYPPANGKPFAGAATREGAGEDFRRSPAPTSCESGDQAGAQRAGEGPAPISLDPIQQQAVELTCTAPIGVVTGGPGCHRRGQKLLKADGTLVAVEDVRVGDELAGFDGQARTVLELRSGYGPMARIVPVKGEPFVVNRDHVLTVVHSCTGEVTDVSVQDFEHWVAKRRAKSKLFRQPFDFQREPAEQPLSPYAVGVFIGDGCLTQGAGFCTPDTEVINTMRNEASRLGARFVKKNAPDHCPTFMMSGPGGPGQNPAREALRSLGLLGSRSEHKFIPDAYKLSPRRSDRLEVLAGLLDTDGHLTCNSFDYVSKSATLANDVAFVARSVGLAAYVSPTEKYCQTGGGGWHWRVSISGHTDMVPNRVPSKKAAPRRQVKNALRTGFTIEHLPPDEFFGFVLNGDGRYLLDDFTVTHNTGKSTCLRYALDRLDAEGKLYHLAAPTGKASKRMHEATGRPARTIHRLLEFNPGAGGFQRRRDNPLDGDAVVVDEASMVDIELAAALLFAIDPRRTRLILVGDADQLPSVGPGRVLADLVESTAVPVVRLQTLHRAAAQSWVHVNAPLILRGQMPDLRPRPDFIFWDVEDAADIADAVRQLVTDKLPQHTGGAEVQVLAPQKTGKAGILALNCMLQDATNPRRAGEKVLLRGDYELRPQDRVIQTKNDYKLEVFNGEVGDVVDVTAKGCTVSFGDRELEYSLEQADALQLAYALTTHRAQGSEWPWVVVVCHSTHTHMLTRQLFYTAVTRAKAGVVIVGNKKGLGVATSDREPPKRNTGLVERMRGEI